MTIDDIKESVGMTGGCADCPEGCDDIACMQSVIEALLMYLKRILKEKE